MRPGRSLRERELRCAGLRITNSLYHRISDRSAAGTGIARIPARHLLDAADGRARWL